MHCTAVRCRLCCMSLTVNLLSCVDGMARFEEACGGLKLPPDAPRRHRETADGSSRNL